MFVKETEEECDPPTSGGQKIANSVEIKEWQNGNVVDNAASRQGIQIRRRPLTGPPKHYVGPFEFRLENEGNTPRNILEKIIWDKDMEVSQAFSKLTMQNWHRREKLLSIENSYFFFCPVKREETFDHIEESPRGCSTC